MKIQHVEFVTSAPSLQGCPPPDKPEIAFAGRSNVGKSSLINSLVLRKGLVRTSSTPGRTQLLNFFAINNDLYFVDLPGYGFAMAPRSVRERWQPMVHGYLKERQSLRAVVWLLDVRRDPNAEDLQFLDWLEENQIPTIPVITKTDKVSRNGLQRRLAVISRRTGLSQQLFTLFSIPQKVGFKEVWELIEAALDTRA